MMIRLTASMVLIKQRTADPQEQSNNERRLTKGVFAALCDIKDKIETIP